MDVVYCKSELRSIIKYQNGWRYVFIQFFRFKTKYLPEKNHRNHTNNEQVYRLDWNGNYYFNTREYLGIIREKFNFFFFYYSHVILHKSLMTLGRWFLFRFTDIINFSIMYMITISDGNRRASWYSVSGELNNSGEKKSLTMKLRKHVFSSFRNDCQIARLKIISTYGFFSFFLSQNEEINKSFFLLAGTRTENVFFFALEEHDHKHPFTTDFPHTRRLFIAHLTRTQTDDSKRIAVLRPAITYIVQIL